jgi:hypothetical protein
MKVAGFVGALALLISVPAFAQLKGRDGQDCDVLKKQAVQLTSKDALDIALHKGIPPADKVYPEAKISWTVLVNQDGFIDCVLDNSQAESWGRLHLMVTTAKALEDWRFKPYISDGKKRPFITKLTFFDDGKVVTVE